MSFRKNINYHDHEFDYKKEEREKGNNMRMQTDAIKWFANEKRHKNKIYIPGEYATARNYYVVKPNFKFKNMKKHLLLPCSKYTQTTSWRNFLMHILM